MHSVLPVAPQTPARRPCRFPRRPWQETAPGKRPAPQRAQARAALPPRRKRCHTPKGKAHPRICRCRRNAPAPAALPSCFCPGSSPPRCAPCLPPAPQPSCARKPQSPLRGAPAAYPCSTRKTARRRAVQWPCCRLMRFRPPCPQRQCGRFAAGRTQAPCHTSQKQKKPLPLHIPLFCR